MRGKYGKPKNWGGLAAVFLALPLDPSERRWEDAAAGVVNGTSRPVRESRKGGPATGSTAVT